MPYANCGICGGRYGGFRNPKCIHVRLAEFTIGFIAWAKENERDLSFESIEL